MPSSARFDPIADWEAALPAGSLETEPGLKEVIDGGSQRALDLLVHTYVTAAVDSGIGRFLQEAGLRQAATAEQLLRAVIAADHYNARIPCPSPRVRNRLAGAWLTYLAERMDQLSGLWGKVLAGWTVWKRIPGNWIPRELVFASITARLRESGYAGVEITGELYPAVPGGEAGLRHACEADRASLPGRCENGVAAIVLYREKGAEAIVVDLERIEEVLTEAGLLLGPPSVTPPATRWVRLLRAAGAGNLWWRLVRWTRKRG